MSTTATFQIGDRVAYKDCNELATGIVIEVFKDFYALSRKIADGELQDKKDTTTVPW